LFERLTDACDIAVSEDSETSLEQLVFRSISSGVLVLKKSNDCLCDGQAGSHGPSSLEQYC
jgi:hypothetical protein